MYRLKDICVRGFVCEWNQILDLNRKVNEKFWNFMYMRTHLHAWRVYKYCLYEVVIKHMSNLRKNMRRMTVCKQSRFYPNIYFYIEQKRKVECTSEQTSDICRDNFFFHAHKTCQAYIFKRYISRITFNYKSVKVKIRITSQKEKMENKRQEIYFRLKPNLPRPMITFVSFSCLFPLLFWMKH